MVKRPTHNSTFAATSRHRDNGVTVAARMLRAATVGSANVNVHPLAIRCVR